MDISDITKLMQQTDLNAGQNTQDEKVVEAFKTIFVEQMIGQLMKTGNLTSGVTGMQKELYEDQLKEALTEHFMDSSGIRWNEILGLSKSNGGNGDER